jgi:hypothetical protein
MKLKQSFPIYKITHKKSGWSVEGTRNQAQAEAAHRCFLYGDSMKDVETCIVGYYYDEPYQDKML